MLNMTAIDLIDTNTEEIDISFVKLKNNNNVISLMKAIQKCKIDVDILNEADVSELIKCILIISR